MKMKLYLLLNKFVKEGNVDLDTFFNHFQHYSVSRRELENVEDNLSKVKLPEKVIHNISNKSTSNFDIFSTYNAPNQPVDLFSKDSTDENIAIINEVQANILASPKIKKRNKNRIPRKFDSKDKQMRMSSAVHYKPLDPGKSPNPVQITSDEESDTKSIEKPVKQEETKFMIPSEGNINKSPMSLFTKATRVSILV